MIEKIVIQKLTIAGKEYEYPDTTALVGKINELADAVNGILDYAPLEMAMKAEPKTESDRTRKALELATERLQQIAHESFQGDQQSINMGFHIRAAAALTDIEQITAITKGDNNE